MKISKNLTTPKVARADWKVQLQLKDGLNQAKQERDACNVAGMVFHYC